MLPFVQTRNTIVLLISLVVLCPCVQAAEKTKVKTAGKPADSRWALLIGVDDYAEAAKLNYCGADMESLRDELVRAGFPAKQVFLLDDKTQDTKYRPLKANIERQLELVLGLVDRGDLIVVGFSGHGVHMDGKSYLCPAETRLNDPTTMVPLDGVYDRLQKCQAALKLLLVDACRNDPRPSGQRSLKPTEGSKQFATSLERPPEGILLLSSCAPGQVSAEDKEFGHGVFMNFVLKGLRGEADKDGDGRVSLLELYQYANRETKTYVARKFNGYQTPALKGDISDDFDLTVSTLKDTVAKIIGRANASVTARQYTKAITDFDEVLRLDPDNADTLNRRGVARERLLKHDEAIADYTAAIRLAPNTAAYYANRGFAYRQKEDWAKAFADFNAAIARDATRADYFNYRGIARRYQKDVDGAIADYTEALRLNPQHFYAFYNRGWLYKGKDDNARALADFNRAIELHGNDSSYYAARGQSYSRMANWEKAIADFSAAIRLKATDADYFNYRGIARHNHNDADGAIADYTEAVRLNPKHKYALANRGLVHKSKGQYDAAILDFNKSLQLDPTYVEALLGRGRTYKAKGDNDTAIADFSEVVRRDATNWNAYLERGKTYFAKNDYARAVHDFTETIRHHPGDADAYDWRGSAHRLKGDLDDAIADFNQALKIDPKYISAYTGRSMAYSKKKMTAQADADAAKARALKLQRNFSKGTTVIVSAPTTNVKVENQIIAVVNRGQSFAVSDSQGQWVLVNINGKVGWISKADVD